MDAPVIRPVDLYVNRLKLLVKWLLLRVFHPILRRLPHISRKRRVVFLCNRTQMVDYLSDVWELFRDDQNLTFYLFLVHGDKWPGEMERVSQMLPVRKIGKLELYLKHWDLVIVADHLHAGTSLTYVNSFSWPILLIPHGISSKLVDGELYLYGKGCHDEKGRIRYTRILVFSESEKGMAIEMNPEFSEKALVVGNLKSDRILEMARHRDDIRHRLGIGHNELLVLIVSTYGPNGLFNMMGEALLKEMRRLSEQFRFALSVHPEEYLSRATGERGWGERLSDFRQEGFWVLDPGERWEPYLVASDVMVTDHSSLTLFGLALGRPYVYAPVPESLVGQHTLTRQLLAISPILRLDASNLTECLLQALNEYPLEKLEELQETLNSFPGEAKMRIRQAIYDLLH